jgi:RNA polymerase sigma-70 factor (ECF subfamily)
MAMTADRMGMALRPHMRAVWRLALSLSGKPDVADDLTQATGLRAMEKATQYAEDGRLQGWLMAICRSIWLNEMRVTQIRRAGGLESIDALSQIDGHPEIETNIFAAEVFTKMMALPEAQRATVELVYVQEFTYSEAAEILDVHIGTVMSHMSTARKTLAPLAETNPGAFRKGLAR